MRRSNAGGTPTGFSTCRQAPSRDKFRTVQSSTDRLLLSKILPPRHVRARWDTRRSSTASSQRWEIAQPALSHAPVVGRLRPLAQFEAITATSRVRHYRRVAAHPRACVLVTGMLGLADAQAELPGEKPCVPRY